MHLIKKYNDKICSAQCLQRIKARYLLQLFLFPLYTVHRLSRKWKCKFPSYYMRITCCSWFINKLLHRIGTGWNRVYVVEEYNYIYTAKNHFYYSIVYSDVLKLPYLHIGNTDTEWVLTVDPPTTTPPPTKRFRLTKPFLGIIK